MLQSTMKLGRKVILISMLFSLLIGLVHSVFSVHAQTNRLSNDLVYVIPIEQTIETGLEQFLSRAFAEAHDMGAVHIVLEVNTFGGRVDSAEAIGDLIRSSLIPTTAFVRGKAISAGAYIALNADQIAMQRGSSIGSAAVVDLSGTQIEDSKTVAMWVGQMRSAAELNGRNPDYAEAMVDERISITVEETGAIYGSGKLLSFSAEEALAAGYAEELVNNLSDVLAFIGAENDQIVHVSASPAERLARLLTNPTTMTILMLVGIIGIATELFIPGFGVPGIVGIAAFGLYFFGQYAAGFAGIEHILLFILGIILLIIEIFVPSFGIFGIAGIISLISGVILAAYDTERALLSLGIASLVAIVAMVFIIRIFKKRGVWNRFVLQDEFKTETGYVSQSSKQHLLGKEGTSLTALRPSGTALIEDQRVDVVSNGEFISANRQIIVTQIEGTRVVVREVKTEEN